MQAQCLHDKQEIAEFLQRNVYLHLYALGDLDDFFWPYTTWYALKERQQIAQVALLYSGSTVPTLLGISEEPLDEMHELLQAIEHLLPQHFYTHLSGNLVTALADAYHCASLGLHYKMALLDKTRLETVATSGVVSLSIADLHELEAFYADSYPGNWFDPRMLETGCYYGLRRDKQLASVAGIHVYSPGYRVAVLGNVTTHPLYRGQGLATAVCAQLCQALLKTVDYVGLNVKTDNLSAIKCYERLGFAPIATYEEFECKR
jgi:ribosomal protein S18 acetylase RimI-like enzyme